MRTVLYLGEAAGGRILAYGDGITQVGDAYQLDVETWDDIPLGEMGDNLFRSIDVAVKHTGAFVLGVTPIVDGVEQPEQTFSASGSGLAQCQAFIATRGTRVAARVRTISRSGTVEIENIAQASVPLRSVP